MGLGNLFTANHYAFLRSASTDVERGTELDDFATINDQASETFKAHSLFDADTFEKVPFLGLGAAGQGEQSEGSCVAASGRGVRIAWAAAAGVVVTMGTATILLGANSKVHDAKRPTPPLPPPPTPSFNSSRPTPTPTDTFTDRRNHYCAQFKDFAWIQPNNDQGEEKYRNFKVDLSQQCIEHFGEKYVILNPFPPEEELLVHKVAGPFPRTVEDYLDSLMGIHSNDLYYLHDSEYEAVGNPFVQDLVKQNITAAKANASGLYSELEIEKYCDQFRQFTWIQPDPENVAKADDRDFRYINVKADLAESCKEHFGTSFSIHNPKPALAGKFKGRLTAAGPFPRLLLAEAYPHNLEDTYYVRVEDKVKPNQLRSLHIDAFDFHENDPIDVENAKYFSGKKAWQGPHGYTTNFGSK